MKLLIVDPNLSLTSPSLKGVVRSIPHLLASGWEVECWCWHADADITGVKIVRLPKFLDVYLLRYYVFSFLAIWRAWWGFAVRRHPRPDVIFTVAWYLPHCDVCLVQFSPWDWEIRQRLLGTKSLRDAVERFANLVSLAWATLFLKISSARRILCVSHAVAADLAKRRPAEELALLPNSYDPKRFCLSVRPQWRESTRKALGLRDDETVFVFVSTGHYRRKGFFLATAAVSLLRRQGKRAKLLVIGGLPATLKRLQAQLSQAEPAWSEWIQFTGMVNDVEKYFAASDAFLFPSYSEAFALVEVEAAACGLPLFLTRHHGSEMILQEGVNGRYLPFDAQAMAPILAEFCDGKWIPQQLDCPNAWDAQTYAEKFLAELESLVHGGKPTTLQVSSAALYS